MTLVSFFQLIRWKNLLMIASIQLLFKYIYFPVFLIDTVLDLPHFLMLVLATICIAAAGNIINDIYDVEADLINKPGKMLVTKAISKKQAYSYYYALNFVGILIGLYISYYVNRTSFVATFIATALLLNVYSASLKKKPIIGNIVVSLLISLSILIVGLFDVIPAITDQNGVNQYFAFRGLIDYAVFAFMLNFLRELVKDVEDVEGDLNLNMQTLPILIGRKKAKFTIFAIAFIPLTIITYYSYANFSKVPIVLVYMLVIVQLPFLHFMHKLLYSETKEHYRYLSRLLKLIMLLGMLSIVVISISIYYAQ